jgi:hypothetical protein
MIHYVSAKSRKEITKIMLVKTSPIMIWHKICWSAILAEIAGFLPFWQLPPFGGGFGLSFLLI